MGLNPFSVHESSQVLQVTGRQNRTFRGIRQFAGFCTAVALIAGFVWIAKVTPAEPEVSVPPTEIPPGKLIAPAKELKYVGVGGCAAAACHGGPLTSDANRLWNCSYTIWATQEPLATAENHAIKATDHARLIDKHNRAYAVLYEKRSKRIAQLLDHLPDAEAAQPYKDARCVACHSVPADPATVPISILADGVGCELCHGPAKNWLARHTEKQWIEDYHSGKYSPLPDMNDTRSLLSRARICAGCHVGSPGDATQLAQDVNHDLIAAGHPRLDFAFHAFLGVLPKHWPDVATKPGFKTDRATHAAAWAVGQVVAAEAALKLLADRAAGDGTDSVRPWPEFSEYDCYACHHRTGEQVPSPRQQTAERRSGSNRLGSLPWGTWYFPEVQFLIASELFGKWYEDFDQPLRELKAQMAAPIAALDRKAIQESATKAAAAMGRMAGWIAEELERSPFDQDKIDRLLLRAADKNFAPADWDEAAQRLLTLDALWDAHQFFQSQLGVALGKDEQAVSDALETIREKLQFPPADTGDGPSAEGRRISRHFDSPKRFDADAVRAGAFQPAFVRIHELLSKKESK